MELDMILNAHLVHSYLIFL